MRYLPMNEHGDSCEFFLDGFLQCSFDDWKNRDTLKKDAALLIQRVYRYHNQVYGKNKWICINCGSIEWWNDMGSDCPKCRTWRGVIWSPDLTLAVKTAIEMQES